MIEKFNKHYEKHLILRVITVIGVVMASMVIMLPLLKIAELFGINLRENGGLNLKVDLPNLIFFLLFVTCTTLVIWVAQKYIHGTKLIDLGFRTKVFKTVMIGFLFGILQTALGYGLMAMTANNVTYTSVIPDDIEILTYIGYYCYFIFGFLILNSYIEELVTRAYPIENLRKHINPHIIFIIMGIIFAAGHFFTRDFNFTYCLTLFIYSYTLSLVYHYSNSIWLVIGLHSGINWFQFSFFGTNWKLGAIAHIEISDLPAWVASSTQPAVGLLALLLIVLLHKKGFFEKLCS